MLPQVDTAGQQKLLNSSALIVGMGGLGSPVAMYLASAGVGRLIIADDDTVELSNLQRQILHGNDDLGKHKVDSAAATLLSLNPEISITKYKQRLDAQALDDLVPQVDVVLDGCDNFATRFAVNRACAKHHIPLVSGAAIRFEGQISVFPHNNSDSPCYHCLYKEATAMAEETCSTNGVIAPLTGLIGSIQAVEAIKVLLNTGTTLTGKLLLIDALHMDIRTLKLKKDPACEVCAN